MAGKEQDQVIEHNSNGQARFHRNSSPRRAGNTNHLADQFTKGAEEAGHEVFRFDAAARQVKPCLGCNHCGMEGPCVHKDDFTTVLRPELEKADMVVFCSPIGILASTDPVALDQACLDLVFNHTDATGDDSKPLQERINRQHGTHITEYAESIGLGTRKYNIKNIDSHE